MSRVHIQKSRDKGGNIFRKGPVDCNNHVHIRLGSQSLKIFSYLVLLFCIIFFLEVKNLVIREGIFFGRDP